jgi:predicted O-methyltransferase YrrM
MINWIAGIIAPHISSRNYKRVAEIGSSTGAASEKLLELTNVNIAIIDPCIDVDLENKFRAETRVRVLKGFSHDILPTLKEKLDCILIDGDHNWYTVFTELQIIHDKDLLSPGGTIFFHDIGWPYGRRDMYYSPGKIPQEYLNPYSRDGIIKGQSNLAEHLSWPHDVATTEGGPRNGVLTAIEDFAKLHRSVYSFFYCDSVEAGLGVLWKKDNSIVDKTVLTTRLKLLKMQLANASISSIAQKAKLFAKNHQTLKSLLPEN